MLAQIPHVILSVPVKAFENLSIIKKCVKYNTLQKNQETNKKVIEIVSYTFKIIIYVQLLLIYSFI